MEFSGTIQIFRMVTFMDADGFLVFIGGKEGLQTRVGLSGLGDSSMTVIFTEGIVAHGFPF